MIKASVGKYTVYASDYCKLDSNVNVGGGTDETEVIQKILDKAVEWGQLYFIVDGAALITGIRVHSNTTIECLNSDCGFYLADDSNEHVIKNADMSVGEIKNRNISLIGGTYNQNCLHQNRTVSEGKEFPQDEKCNAHLTGMKFFGVKNFKMRDVTICDNKRYALIMGNWENVQFDNINIPLPNLVDDSNQDGLHFHGPGNNLIIRNCYGRGGDDLIALNADEGDAKSSIKNVLIDGVYLNNAYQAIRLLCRDQGFLENITIRNVKGTVRSFGFFIDPWFPGASGLVKNVLIEDVHLKQNEHVYSYHEPFMFSIAGRVENVSIKNCSIETDNSEFKVLEIREAHGKDGVSFTNVKNLNVDGLYVKDLSDSSSERILFRVEKGTYADKISLKNIYAETSSTQDALLHICDNAHLDKLELVSVEAKGFKNIVKGKSAYLFEQNLSTIE